MPYNENIATAIKSFFEEVGWNYSINEETGKISSVKLPIWHRDEFNPDKLYYIEGDIIRYDFNVKQNGFLIYAEYPWTAKKRKRKSLLEFIKQLNTDNPDYNFTYDEKSFKTRFNYEVICTDENINAEMIEEKFRSVYGVAIENSSNIKQILGK